MTSAAALSASGTLPWGAPVGRRGPSLRLVPTRVVTPTPTSPDDAHAVRLTRRGRLAVTLSVVAVLAATPLTVASLIESAGAGTEVVVRSGQTLSQVAATQLPQERLDLAIVRIQRVNSLSSNELQAGQVLQIPKH